MKNVAFIAIVLAVGFSCQIVWWRVRGPSLSSIPALFILVFIFLGATAVFRGVIDLAATDYARLALFYGALVLGYTILCSAIEARSPTLSIITHIAGYGQGGCPEEDLIASLLAEDAMMDRMRLMQRSGLVQIVDGRCALTRKGALFAHLFEFGGRIFGVAEGG